MEPKPNQDQIMTIGQFIHQYDHQQQICHHILQKDESNICSFTKGYIHQKLFGCYTCAVQLDQQIGFCLACYLKCHLDHHTFEIGVKRNFRCDCNHGCQFHSKTQSNANHYDHNFSNQFCKCKQAYDENEFMINCIGCLDFFHLYHLPLTEHEQTVIENTEDYSLMVCPDCVRNKYYILASYQNDPTIVYNILQDQQQQSDSEQSQEKDSGQKRSRQQFEKKDCKVNKVYDREKVMSNYDGKPLFMVYGFQQNLCTCYDCIKLNKDLELDQIKYLEDQNAEYLNCEYEEDQQQYDQADRQFIDLEQVDTLIQENMKQYDHVTQCNIAYRINELKQKMVQFLQNTDQDKVVTKEDILPLIQELQKNKKKRIE